MSDNEKNESTLDKSLDDMMSNEKNTDNKDVKVKNQRILNSIV